MALTPRFANRFKIMRDITSSGFALIADNITDASTLGKALLKAADAATMIAALPSALVKNNATSQIQTGYTTAPVNLGNLTSFTPNIASRNMQYGTNAGAITITAPSADGAVEILITNAANAGSINFSGFTAPAGGGGDTYVTTSGYKFLLMIRRINGISTYAWKAYQ